MKKKLFAMAAALVLCASMLTGCFTAINAAGIQHPEEIEYITVEMRGGFIREFNGETEIKQICDFIEAALPTNQQSVNDEPTNVDGYGIITMYHTGITKIYYYEKNGKYYLEIPYSQVYQTKEDFEDDFLPFI